MGLETSTREQMSPEEFQERNAKQLAELGEIINGPNSTRNLLEFALRGGPKPSDAEVSEFSSDRDAGDENDESPGKSKAIESAYARAPKPTHWQGELIETRN